MKKHHNYLKITCGFVCTGRNNLYLCTRFWKEHYLEAIIRKAIFKIFTYFFIKTKQVQEYKIYLYNGTRSI